MYGYYKTINPAFKNVNNVVYSQVKSDQQA